MIRRRTSHGIGGASEVPESPGFGTEVEPDAGQDYRPDYHERPNLQHPEGQGVATGTRKEDQAEQEQEDGKERSDHNVDEGPRPRSRAEARIPSSRQDPCGGESPGFGGARMGTVARSRASVVDDIEVQCNDDHDIKRDEHKQCDSDFLLDDGQEEQSGVSP